MWTRALRPFRSQIEPALNPYCQGCILPKVLELALGARGPTRVVRFSQRAQGSHDMQGAKQNARKAKSRMEKPDCQPKAGLKSRIKSRIGLIRLLAVPGQ